VKYADAFAVEETALARTDIAVNEFHRLVDDLWPVEPGATDRSRGIAARRKTTLRTMFDAETGKVGRTAYAAERTITDYLDHVAPRRPGKTMSEEISRATGALEGIDDELKNKAHKRLMTLVNR